MPPHLGTHSWDARGRGERMALAPAEGRSWMPRVLSVEQAPLQALQEVSPGALWELGGCVR